MRCKRCLNDQGGHYVSCLENLPPGPEKDRAGVDWDIGYSFGIIGKSIPREKRDNLYSWMGHSVGAVEREQKLLSKYGTVIPIYDFYEPSGCLDLGGSD